MNLSRIFIKLFLVISLIFLTLVPPNNPINAETTTWEEVATTEKGIQYIDTSTIKYDTQGILSVSTKYSEINPEDQKIINTNIYIMEINCDKRIFKDISVNGKSTQGGTWESSRDDKLIKKTIIKSCSY